MVNGALGFASGSLFLREMIIGEASHTTPLDYYLIMLCYGSRRPPVASSVPRSSSENPLKQGKLLSPLPRWLYPGEA